MAENAGLLFSRRRTLRPAAQVPGQEPFHPAVEFEAVLLVVKPMPLIVLHDVLDSGDHLTRLGAQKPGDVHLRVHVDEIQKLGSLDVTIHGSQPWRECEGPSLQVNCRRMVN